MILHDYKVKEFQEAVEVIKNLGYQVYGHQWQHGLTASTYGHIRGKDGKRVAYFQIDDFGLVQFSTCHKPNKQCGTGVSINDEGYWPSAITEKVIERVLGIVYPYRCAKSDREAILKNQWSSFDEWVAYESKFCKIVEL